MPSPTPGRPRVIHLGPRPRAAGDDAHPAPLPGRLRRLAQVPATAVLVAASLLWPFLVLAPLGGGPAEVRLVEDDDTADLGVAYGPGGAATVSADGALVVDQVSAALAKIAPPGLQEPGTVLDPSALAASGIPEVALRAYEAAQASLLVSDPSCGLPWWLLAGIGRVESNHGQYAGAVLLQDGTSAPPVIGIPLDGRPGVALIRDTDGGRLDGDTVYDRAVGPMQFIPSTWAGSQVDGDGDGEANPHDIDDAALASGQYLCRGGSDLTTEAGLRSAVFRYNHSDAYVDLVLSIGRAYATGDVPVIAAGDATRPTASPTTSAPTADPSPTAAPTTPPTTSPTSPPTSTPPTTTPPTTPPTSAPPTCTPDPTGSATTSPTSPPPTPSPTTPPCEPCPTTDPTTSPTTDPTGAPTPGPTPSPSCTVPTTAPTGTTTTTP